MFSKYFGNKFEKYAAQSEDPVDTEIKLNQTVFHSKSFEEIERDILNNGENGFLYKSNC